MLDAAPTLTASATTRDTLALRLVATALTRCAWEHENAATFCTTRSTIAAAAQGALAAAYDVAETTALRAQLHELSMAAAHAVGVLMVLEGDAAFSRGFAAGRVSL